MAEPAAHDESPEPTPAATGSVTMFLKQLCLGNAAAARELWIRFLPRMHGLARKTLSRHPQRVSDADDAVQSAFLAFWQHVRLGRVSESADRDDLWNLLAVMTVRKSLKQISRWGAEKRGGNHVVVRESEMGSAGETFRLDEALAVMPTPEFDLHCEELLLQLTDEEREIAMLRLMGHSNREIAALRGCTERKIQRKLKLAQLRWEQGAAAAE